MRLTGVVGGLLVAGFIAAAGLAVWVTSYRSIDPIRPPSRSGFDAAAVKKGQSLVALGNCSGCHTKPGGEPFAGGLPLATPFGTIYSTNITPDPDSGIGRWSEAAFRRAMREGIDREGNFLYPAFPYDHYTKVTDDDSRAIYAFLMAQRPARTTPIENELSFPFSIRTLVAGWNLLFFKSGPFQPAPSKDERWNRGAYLVQGLGHCSSCHTARNMFGALKSDQYLGGALVDGWWAPALAGRSSAGMPWTEDALVNYLIDGWDEHHGVAGGPMTGVVNQLADQDEEDVVAMAAYLRSLQERPASEDQIKQIVAAARQRDFAPGRAGAAGSAQSPADPASARGEAVFARACANCHRAGGVSASQPVPLALTAPVSAPSAGSIVRVVLEGIKPPKGAPDKTMPAFSSLSDDDLADLVAFVRARFSQQAPWGDVREHIAAARGTGKH